MLVLLFRDRTGQAVRNLLYSSVDSTRSDGCLVTFASLLCHVVPVRGAKMREIVDSASWAILAASFFVDDQTRDLVRKYAMEPGFSSSRGCEDG